MPSSVWLRNHFSFLVTQHDPHEIGHVSCPDLGHDIGAMEFDRPRTDTKLSADLFARSALNNLGQHRLFPMREFFSARQVDREFSDGVL